MPIRMGAFTRFSIAGPFRVESTKQVAEFRVNDFPFNPIPNSMIVQRNSLALAALLAVLSGPGCSDRDATPFAAEIDEPSYRQGQQRMREGRAPEALTWFLKVIEKRGEQNAPESHL